MATIRRGKGYRLIWRGDEVVQQKREQTAKALAEIGLRVEGEAKKELYKGHGVLTGTLRRSIHTATPGYNWGGDNASLLAAKQERAGYHPEMGLEGIKKAVIPELGGQLAMPFFDRDSFVIQVGSGLEYAIFVHQGHHTFEGYHFITNGLARVRPLVPGIVRKHAGR